MLHTTRPSSSDAYQPSGVGSSYQQPQRVNNTPRSVYNSSSGYRGPSTAAVQPYAFQNTPHLRQETRTISAPITVPQSQSTSSSTSSTPRHGHRSTPSTSTVSSDMSSAPSAKAQRSPTKDDMFSGSARNSFINISSSVPDLSLTPYDTTPKSSPGRYRRTPQRENSSNSVSRPNSSAAPSGSGMAAIGHLYTPPPPQMGQMSRTPSDDLTITKAGASTSEAAKRYRRRSMNSLDSNVVNPAGSNSPTKQSLSDQRPSSQGGQPSSTIRPVSFHSRTPSAESGNARRAISSTPPVSYTDLVSGSYLVTQR